MREIPRILEVEKIVTLYAEQIQVVEIERPVITPVEIPVPVDRIIEKLAIQEEIR